MYDVYFISQNRSVRIGEELFCVCERLLFFSFSEDQEAFHIPKTIDDAKILGNILYKYSKHHRYIIMTAFFLTYIL